MNYTLQLLLNYFISFLLVIELAHNFGTSAEKSIFDICGSIPFLIVAIAGFNWLHSSLIKKFASIDDPEVLGEEFSRVLNYLILIFIVFYAVFFICNDLIMAILAPGLYGAYKEELRIISLISAASVGGFLLYTYFSAVLIAKSVALTTEIANALARLIGIAYLLSVHIPTTVHLTLVLSIASWFSALVFLLIIVFRLKISYRFTVKLRTANLLKAYRSIAYILIAALLTEAAGVTMRSLCTLIGSDFLAAFAYAVAIASPMAILIGKPIGLTLSTRYLSYQSKKDYQAAHFVFKEILFTTLAISLSGALFVSYFRTDLLRLIYYQGNFSPESLATTSYILSYLVIAVPAYALMSALWIPFTNMIDTKRIYRGTKYLNFCLSVASLLNIMISLLLFRIYREQAVFISYVFFEYFKILLMLAIYYKRNGLSTVLPVV